MRVFHFQQPDSVSGNKPLDDYSQLKWVDYSRSDELNIDILGNSVHLQHLKDLQNSSHPPFYEQTEAYDMIIFRTMDERFDVIEPRTRSTALIIRDNTLITVHDENDTTLTTIFNNWTSGVIKQPANIVSLIYVILNEIVDVFLNLREPLIHHVSEWQRKLLDPNDPFDNWHIIMQAKSSLRALNSNLELQSAVLADWRKNTRLEFNASQIIKFNDLNDHMSRIERLSEGLRSDLDSLTQIYFASTGQKTNINVQFLAAISAIFLPLNLIAGIFGMNFESLPFIKDPLSPFILIAMMIIVAVFLLFWFKKKKWY